MRSCIASKYIRLIITIGLVFSVLLPVSCSNTKAVNDDANQNTVNEKVSSQLLAQVYLRKEQVAEPTSDRLELMKNMGMRVDDLEIQMIFIHLSKKLSPSQIEELEAMGLNLYLDSWIPPVGAHPTGFVIADMPVDKLGALAEKGYVVRLDTAERQLAPQGSIKPQAG